MIVIDGVCAKLYVPYLYTSLISDASRLRADFLVPAALPGGVGSLDAFRIVASSSGFSLRRRLYFRGPT